RKTFQMTNIAPQRPALNRGPWRELEQYIANLWTAKYGEIWVIAGTVPARTPAKRARLGDTSIEIPEKFYMVIASQTEDSVRVLAVLMDQNAGRWDFPVHSIVSVDELERLTGLDFFPEMQKSLQTSLEADVPTRLWPIRALDLLKLILLRFA
ncbi:MAG: DNA/RNA non-specific endonuclease, partial [Kiritimatiellia bacterium]